MKQLFFTSLCAFTLSLAAPAFAQSCYADYKAKQDDPLRLHFGVAQVKGVCSIENAQVEIRERLAPHGWKLLIILNTFGPEGLEERKDSAGQYYLRF